MEPESAELKMIEADTLTGFLGALPNEILLQLISFLGGPGTVSLGYTCKRFSKTCFSPNTWKMLCWVMFKISEKDVNESLLAVNWFDEYQVIHSYIPKIYGNKLVSNSTFLDFKLGNVECTYTHDNGLGDQLTLLDDHSVIAVIQTQHPLFPLPRRKCNVGYYECTILATEFRGTAVGLAACNYSTAMPGWYRASFGCHGDDGRLYFESNLGRAGTDVFSPGDVIGCGIHFDEHCIFFTKNGQLFSWHKIDKSYVGHLFPTIGIYRKNDSIRVNFGTDPFEFAIDDLNSHIEKFIAKKNADRMQALQEYNAAVEAFVREHGPLPEVLPPPLARQFACIPAEIPTPQSISRSGAFAFVHFSKRVRNIHYGPMFTREDFLADPQNAVHYGFVPETDDSTQLAMMIAGLIENLKNLEDRTFTSAEIQDWLLYQAKELNIDVGAEPDLEQLRIILTNNFHMMLADLCLRDLSEYWEVSVGRKKGNVPRMDPQFDLFVIATLMLANQEIPTASPLMQMHLDKVQEEYESDPNRPPLDGLDDETRRMHLLYFFAMLVQRSLDTERKRQKKLLRGAAKSEFQSSIHEPLWLDANGKKWRAPYMSLLDIEDCVGILADEDIPDDDRVVVDTIWRLVINRDCRPLFVNLKLSLSMRKLRQAAIDLLESERDYIYDYLDARPDEADRLVAFLDEWLDRLSRPPANDAEARENEDYIRKRLFSPAQIQLPTQENTVSWVIERLEREIDLLLKSESSESSDGIRKWTLIAGAVAIAAAAAAGTLYYFLSTSENSSSSSSSSSTSGSEK